MTPEKKPRPLCLVCGKPISAANCGFPKRDAAPPVPPLVIDVETLQRELEIKLRERGVID